MSEITCPECENPLRMKSRAKIGQQFTCRHCQTTLEVISLNPIEVDFAQATFGKRARKNADRRTLRRQSETNREEV